MERVEAPAAFADDDACARIQGGAAAFTQAPCQALRRFFLAS